MNATPTLPRRGRYPLKTGPNMLSITLQMSQHLIDRLDTAALADGIVSRSELVRIACEEYLRRRGKRVGGISSFLGK